LLADSPPKNSGLAPPKKAGNLALKSPRSIGELKVENAPKIAPAVQKIAPTVQKNSGLKVEAGSNLLLKSPREVGLKPPTSSVQKTNVVVQKPSTTVVEKTPAVQKITTAAPQKTTVVVAKKATGAQVATNGKKTEAVKKIVPKLDVSKANAAPAKPKDPTPRVNFCRISSSFYNKKSKKLILIQKAN
jgi:hypothetical protein